MGINLMSARALLTLRNGAATIGALALATGIDQPTLSHTLNRLLADKLIVKERQRHDNRSVRVELTRSGRKMSDRCFEQNRRYEKLVTSQLSATKVKVLKDMLKQMYANVRQLSGREVAPLPRKPASASARPRRRAGGVRNRSRTGTSDVQRS
jgi:DNA-binding MarR family transcriptional regulator